MSHKPNSTDRCEAQVADGQRCVKPGYYIVIVPGREDKLCKAHGDTLLGDEPTIPIIYQTSQYVGPIPERVSLN